MAALKTRIDTISIGNEDIRTMKKTLSKGAVLQQQILLALDDYLKDGDNRARQSRRGPLLRALR